MRREPTPGTWEFATFAGWPCVVDPENKRIIAFGGYSIAELKADPRKAAEITANAHLCAAAKEMRDALTELARCIRGGDETAGVSLDDALLDADAAVEKARGEA